MRRRLPVPERLRDAPFARSEARELSSRQLASDAYERLARGAYRTASSDGGARGATYGERVAAVLAVMPSRAVLVGASAAWAMRAWAPLADEAVEVNVHPPGSVRGRDGVQLSAARLAPGDVVRRLAGPATTPLRTAVDVARRPGALADVVPLLDAVMRAGRLVPDQVLAAVLRDAGHRGNSRARIALAAADPLAESARESLVRLVVARAGLPRPVLQHWVTGADGGRYRLDLAWPQSRSAAEYDGLTYHGPEQRAADLARHNALRAAGWTVIQLDAAALARPEVWLAQLASLLS